MIQTLFQAARLPLLAAALAALAGCAGPRLTDFNHVSVREQHQWMPSLTWDERRPLAVVTAGPTGLLVGTGNAAPAPAVALVMQDGQARLVSQQTLASMQQQGTAMGASPAAPAGGPSTAPAATGGATAPAAR